MQHSEGRFRGHDGVDLYWQAWRPHGPATATVVVLHGIFEHSGRYAHVGAALSARGYAVHAMDYRGHGRSGGPRAMIRRFDDYVADVERFVDRVTFAEPGRPLFLFGHSLGGQLALLYAIAKQPPLAGLILSAPAIRVGEGVFPLLRHLASVLSAVCPRLRLVRMGCRNISRDPRVVEQFKQDPLVFHDRFPVRTGAEALRAARQIRTSLAQVRLPLLVIHGTGDVVAAVAGSEELCREVASTDKTLKLYDGLYHECLSEPEQRQVLADMLAWLDARR